MRDLNLNEMQQVQGAAAATPWGFFGEIFIVVLEDGIKSWVEKFMTEGGGSQQGAHYSDDHRTLQCSPGQNLAVSHDHASCTYPAPPSSS